MTTRLTFDPNENYEQAGLLVYGDDANYVKADYVYANGRGLEFLREANNTAAGFGGFVGIGTKPTTVDMRITSDGTTLRAYYRFAGEGGRRTASRRCSRACRTRRSASTRTTATPR